GARPLSEDGRRDAVAPAGHGWAVMSAITVRDAPPAADLRSAYEWCRAYARRRDENFNVVSWFLPRDVRPHFFALYAYCRWSDDLGDEAEGDRLALLDAW